MDGRFQKKTDGPELNPWDQMALNVMYANKGADGQLGVMIENGPQGREWYRYFKGMGMHAKADHLASNMRQNRHYMVPTEWPEQLDPTFIASLDRSVQKKERTPEDREAVIKRAYAIMGFTMPQERI